MHRNAWIHFKIWEKWRQTVQSHNLSISVNHAHHNPWGRISNLITTPNGCPVCTRCWFDVHKVGCNVRISGHHYCQYMITTHSNHFNAWSIHPLYPLHKLNTFNLIIPNWIQSFFVSPLKVHNKQNSMKMNSVSFLISFSKSIRALSDGANSN